MELTLDFGQPIVGTLPQSPLALYTMEYDPAFPYQLRDQSGNGYHWLLGSMNAPNTNAPVFGPNGGLRFDALDDFLLPVGGGIPIPGDYSIIWVAQPNSFSAFRTVVGSNNASAYSAFNTSRRVLAATHNGTTQASSSVLTSELPGVPIMGGMTLKRGVGVRAIRNGLRGALSAMVDSAENVLTRIGARANNAAVFGEHLDFLAVYSREISDGECGRAYPALRRWVRNRRGRNI